MIGRAEISVTHIYIYIQQAGAIYIKGQAIVVERRVSNISAIL
jgi:hypothetical protein